MNNILQLRGQFQQQKYKGNVGPGNIPAGASVKAEHLLELSKQLEQILNEWKGQKIINGALVSARYYHVVAKSNRIKGLLVKGSEDPNDYICGSKFLGDDPMQHVFVYYVKLDAIEESIKRLNEYADILNRNYNGRITHENIVAINTKEDKSGCFEGIRTSFVKVITDAYYVQYFFISRDDEEAEYRQIVSIYKTDMKASDILSKLGISMIDDKMIDETTFRLAPREFELLRGKASFLIAMKTHDISEMMPEDFKTCDPQIVTIPDPTNEPVIGVIDTLFSSDVYFDKWVTYSRRVDENLNAVPEDYEHGTEVDSIIVDGPTINPELDDGCGRFRVRHFGVALHGSFSSFTILKSLREIVAENRDIKVWNFSLGSKSEINKNFISPEAAELDRIQSDYDVIFIVAGTNKTDDLKGEMRIGSPADSLNSLVVNAVDFSGKPTSYHRVGPVLSFFNKPDVSYYGGDSVTPMRVCTSTGEKYAAGTSFAAPWIARKMAYLIYNMGFSREIAKALLIDSAAGWNRQDDTSHSVGYGVVPIRIEDILSSHDDEIRFVLTGASEAFETYSYNIPIPIYKDKQPFFARATICYFPRCSRNQGVDYTSTEMDIHFGRVNDQNGTAQIDSINKNQQSDAGCHVIREENARKLYRKWDNVKLISDVIKDRSRPRKVYGLGMWGLSIKTKERSSTKNGKGMPFGVVITLKEMNGANRIDDFIKLCMMRGWIVNRVDVENQVEVYNKADQDVELE